MNSHITLKAILAVLLLLVHMWEKEKSHSKHMNIRFMICQKQSFKCDSTHFLNQLVAMQESWFTTTFQPLHACISLVFCWEPWWYHTPMVPVSCLHSQEGQCCYHGQGDIDPISGSKVLSGWKDEGWGRIWVECWETRYACKISSCLVKSTDTLEPIGKPGEVYSLEKQVGLLWQLQKTWNPSPLMFWVRMLGHLWRAG